APGCEVTIIGSCVPGFSALLVKSDCITGCDGLSVITALLNSTGSLILLASSVTIALILYVPLSIGASLFKLISLSFWSYTFNVLTKWSLVEKLSFPTILDTLLSINCISSSFELNLFGTVIAAFVSCSKTRGLVTSTGTTKKFIASREVSGFKLLRYDKAFKLAYNWNLLIARFLPSLILRPPSPAELSFAISFVPSAPLIIR